MKLLRPWIPEQHRSSTLWLAPKLNEGLKANQILFTICGKRCAAAINIQACWRTSQTTDAGGAIGYAPLWSFSLSVNYQTGLGTDELLCRQRWVGLALSLCRHQGIFVEARGKCLERPPECYISSHKGRCKIWLFFKSAVRWYVSTVIAWHTYSQVSLVVLSATPLDLRMPWSSIIRWITYVQIGPKARQHNSH